MTEFLRNNTIVLTSKTFIQDPRSQLSRILMKNDCFSSLFACKMSHEIVWNFGTSEFFVYSDKLAKSSLSEKRVQQGRGSISTFVVKLNRARQNKTTKINISGLSEYLLCVYNNLCENKSVRLMTPSLRKRALEMNCLAVTSHCKDHAHCACGTTNWWYFGCSLCSRDHKMIRVSSISRGLWLA